MAFLHAIDQNAAGDFLAVATCEVSVDYECVALFCFFTSDGFTPCLGEVFGMGRSNFSPINASFSSGCGLEFDFFFRWFGRSGLRGVCPCSGGLAVGCRFSS